MTRLTKTTLYGTVAALAVVAYAEKGFAEEGVDFEQYLRGASIGLTAAAPKPGLYFSNTSVLLPWSKGFGQDSPAVTNTWGNASTLVWSSGLTFLGGSYIPSVGQTYYQAMATLKDANSGFPSMVTGNNAAAFFMEIHNTYVDPINFAWNLGGGWFMGAGMGLYLPDGSTFYGSLNPDFLTYEPHFILSYLANDWNLTANVHYEINTPSAGKFGAFQFTSGAGNTGPSSPTSPGYGYLSGQLLFLDWTATKKFGKWELGPVGYIKTQTTLDQPGGGYVCSGPGNGVLTRAGTNSLQVLAALDATNRVLCGYDRGMGLGALLGYDFGPMALKLWGTLPVRGVLGDTDQFSGSSVFLRMSFKVWDPDYKEPLPMVTK
jgi:hypothetical protein